MNIIIAGAGTVGLELVEQLTKEGHNLVIVDVSAAKVESAVNAYDIRGVVGNGANHDVLKEAGAKNAQLFIAASEQDEINILACLVARNIGTKFTVARVRNPEYASMFNGKGNVGLSLMVNPEYETSEEILRILKLPSAINIHKFSDGNADLVERKIERDSKLNGVALKDLHLIIRQKILVCAVARDNDVFIPSGDFKLREDDIIYFTAPENEISDLFKDLHIHKHARNILIAGGSKITYYLAKGLDKLGYTVKVVEEDESACKTLAENLKYVDIINGSPTDQALLLSEGIASVDAFIALTDNDEANIMLTMFAKAKNVRKIITKIDNDNYYSMLHSDERDTIVSAKISTAEQIVRYVRSFTGDTDNPVKKLYRIVDEKAEALEFMVGESFKGVGITLKDLSFKKNLLIGGIIRAGEFIAPSGNDTIEVGDSVIIVTTNAFFDDLNDILA